MGRNHHKEVEIKVHPRSSGNAVHPVGSLPPHASHGSRDSPGDFNPFKKWFPWLVPSFVVVNIALFVATMYLNNCPEKSSSCVFPFLGRFAFQPLKENPLLGPSSSTLEKMGALDVTKVVGKHQAWRLVTCIWLHAGVFHVLANMLSLVVIGIRLEQEFGFVRIGVLYMISGSGGSLLSALFVRSNISVGASGALFGLLGSMLSELLTNWTIYSNKFAALLTLVTIISLNLALGILPRVDNFAHIGGFLSGFFLGFVFLIRPQYRWIRRRSAPPGRAPASSGKKHKVYQYVLWVLSLVLLLAGFVVGLILLFQGVNVNDHCSWCHYLSCVPTPLWSCKPQEVHCESSQIGNQRNVTCLNNGRSQIYTWQNESTSEIRLLCASLCST